MREKSLGVPVKQLSSPRVKGFRCTPHSCFKSTPRIELPAEQLKFQSTPRAKREANLNPFWGEAGSVRFNPRLALSARRTRRRSPV